MNVNFTTMEPNENPKRQRELVEELLAEPFEGDAKDLVQAGLGLARLVKELDEHLFNHGYGPEAWGTDV
jgi:hypothetical protein